MYYEIMIKYSYEFKFCLYDRGVDLSITLITM